MVQIIIASHLSYCNSLQTVFPVLVLAFFQVYSYHSGQSDPKIWKVILCYISAQNLSIGFFPCHWREEGGRGTEGGTGGREVFFNGHFPPTLIVLGPLLSYVLTLLRFTDFTAAPS